MRLPSINYLATALAITFAFPAVSADISAEQAKSKFESLLPFKIKQVSEAPVSGFYQLESEKGIFYASRDGEYIFSGSLHQFSDGLLNLTALRQRALANDQMKAIQDELIVFPAKDEKYRVTVFTDPTCGYCRKLHSEIEGYNALGITIAYAAFPRGGINSDMDRLLKDVWCSKDQNQALTDSKNDIAIARGSCETPVDEMYSIGESLGINGTPAIILPNGEMVPGYRPPEQLLKTLENAG
ncbi:thiol:disulfide interchange protein DsbC [Shewanella algicola]|uniref:Thiol:disulfide interchange protein n=1 Tax=Shewanella algicola TaxID=640633 RepID=A0A9X2CEK2_9GAMM|nr:thioredoxin fold domain-containing protein [Shewanella algicola]MCL1106347.1 thioredoxin fold domain-containing protein [Shewanella algicola]GGP59037.1 thiol:disulfide interchange protein DsbC [Shewanella algicola]